MSPLLLLLVLQASAEPPPLLTAAAVRQLSPEAAGAKRPVRLTGVVTHANSHLGDFFVQDETAGVYAVGGPAGLAAGDRVEVEGETDGGAFAPSVRARAVRRLGPAPLPDAEPYELRREAARWLDGQYVQAYVCVREVGTDGGFTTVSVVTAAGRGVVRIPGDHLEAVRPLVERTVRVRGVCAASHDGRSRRPGPQGPTVFAQSPAELVPLPSAGRRDTPAPLARYLEELSSVARPSARPVVVEGTVTAVAGRRQFFLQDDSGGVFVTAAGEARVAPGDRVVASGFLRVVEPRVLLDNAAVRQVGTGPLPEPLPVEPPALDPATFGRLVRVEGVVEEAHHRDGSFSIDLHNGPVRLQGLLFGQARPESLAGLVPGARVRLTGASYSYRGPDLQSAEARVVVLRSAADVEVLELPPGPPWWTSRRVALLSLVFMAVLTGGALWVLSLLRQARHQTAVIREQFRREAQLSESLQRARRLEAVGRLAGGIAHDFNNLLTVIIGNSDLVAHELPRGDSNRELAETVRSAGERAADLTRQLLTFSRQRPTKLTPLDLNEAVADAERLLARLVGEHIRLEVRRGANLPPVLADTSLIHQVLLNLAANARDAMPQGGALRIETALALDGRDRGVVRLSVADTGCGMDEPTRSRAFEPFFTTKGVGKGTGLGLATVYGAVAEMGGVVRIESAPGRGTTFVVDLPPQQVSGVTPIAEPPPPPSGRGAVVLLVDDDEGVRGVCEKSLHAYGYRVLASDSPEAALDAARAADGPIDLLVTDLIMPGMNGHELAAALRSERPDLRVLFMSGYPKDEVRRMVGDLPAVKVIQKPFSPLQLAVRVQKMIGGGSAR